MSKHEVRDYAGEEWEEEEVGKEALASGTAKTKAEAGLRPGGGDCTGAVGREEKRV